MAADDRNSMDSLSLSSRIIILLQKKGYTLAKIGQLMQVGSHALPCQIRAGTRNFTLARLEILAKALNLKVSKLISKAEEEGDVPHGLGKQDRLLSNIVRNHSTDDKYKGDS